MKFTTNIILFTCFLIHAESVRSQASIEAYRIYDRTGKAYSFEEMSSKLSKNDVILFGEMHNNPIDHWLQLELIKHLHKTEKLTLGAEMFERDNQLLLSEYLLGTITLDHFKKEAKLWPNYTTDYAPLVEFAKENDLAFIATNVPRRYASLVARVGLPALDSLTDDAKRFLPTLPFLVDTNDLGYQDMIAMMGGHGMNIDYLVAAQALKDYTMASAISENFIEKGLFIHFNGSFHSQKFSGINTYLGRLNANLNIGVIASAESENLDFQDEWKELGDFIIVTNASMTKTH